MEIFFALVGLVILLFSAIVHEIAHGYVAERLGDPTARLMGRLTLDPRRHIDPFLSIILPATLFFLHSPILFGGAKPVPVDPFNLRDGRKDMALVSLAGPATNLVLAVVAALLLKGVGFIPVVNPTIMYVTFFLHILLTLIAHYNLLLAIFNLLPIPPLDGSKIFSLFLPEKEAAAFLSLGQYGIFILLLLLAFPIGGFSLQNILYTLLSFGENLLGL